jgi:hypothetical protein
MFKNFRSIKPTRLVFFLIVCLIVQRLKSLHHFCHILPVLHELMPFCTAPCRQKVGISLSFLFAGYSLLVLSTILKVYCDI